MVSMLSNIYMMADISAISIYIGDGGDNENVLSRSPDKETVRR